MVNLDKVIPILKKALPKANDKDLKVAIAKAEKAIPNLTDMQLIGLVLKSIRAEKGLPDNSKVPQQVAQPQPQPPFGGVMNQLSQGVQ